MKELIKQYSEFIGYPIQLYVTKETPKQVVDTEATEKAQKEEDEKAEKEEREAKTIDNVMKTEMETKQEFEVQNTQKPIWARPTNEPTRDEYNSFFKSTFTEFMDPLTYKHFKAEGTVEFSSLLYIPSRAPME